MRVTIVFEILANLASLVLKSGEVLRSDDDNGEPVVFFSQCAFIGLRPVHKLKTWTAC